MARSEEGNSLYIVGVGRSGTSLLQSMLASHSQVSFLPETGFVRRHVFSMSVCQYLCTNMVRDNIRKDNRLNRLDLDFCSLMEAIPVETPALNLALDLQRKIKSSARRNQEKFVGDKDPKLVEYLPALAAVMSESVIIHLVRDPRDVLVSKKKAEWSMGRHFWLHLLAGYAQLKWATRFFSQKTVRSSQRLSLRYEDLIRDPEGQLKAICEALDVRFEDSMLAFGQAAKTLVADDELSWKKETFGPLLQNNHAKWKKDLTPRELILAEKCFRSLLIENEYELSGTKKASLIADKVWIYLGSVFVMLSAQFLLFIFYLRSKWLVRKYNGARKNSM